MTRNRPQGYEWWIDSIQDSLAQIAQEYDSINVGSNAGHVCDETYVDLAHFVDTVTVNGFCDVLRDVWRRIVELAAADDLESVASRSLAAECLASYYLRPIELMNDMASAHALVRGIAESAADRSRWVVREIVPPRPIRLCAEDRQ